MLVIPDFFISKAISLSIASERVPVGSCQVIFNFLFIISSQNALIQSLFIIAVRS